MGSLVGQRECSGQAPVVGRDLYGETKSWTGAGSHQERLRQAAGVGRGVGLVPPVRRGGRPFGRYCSGCRRSCRGREGVVAGVVSRTGAVESSQARMDGSVGEVKGCEARWGWCEVECGRGGQKTGAEVPRRCTSDQWLETRSVSRVRGASRKLGDTGQKVESEVEVEVEVKGNGREQQQQQQRGQEWHEHAVQDKQLLSNEAWRGKSSRVGACVCRGSRREKPRHVVPSVFRSTYGPARSRRSWACSRW